MRYEDASGAFQASGPIANDDADTLSAGQKLATGNVITGEGTQYGASGADSAAGAQVAAIAGKGGEDSSFSGGKLSVAGEHGRLTVDADGNYSYQVNANVENVRDRFTYTLADNAGNSDTAALIIEIGKTPAVIKANAQQIVPGPDGVVTLPPGVELSDVRVVGRNLVVDLPDGTQLIIIDGAIFVPQLVLNGVEVPATNVAALLIGQEVQPAAGEIPPSGGGNFALPPPPLDPGIPLGDLIPPTELDYAPPEPEEVFDILDEEPEAGSASAQLDDDALEGGIAGGTGDDPDSVGTEGFLPGSGGDGDLTWSLLLTGAPAGFTYVDGPGESVLIQQNGVTVLTVTVDPATGEYSVVQNAPIDHAAGQNENNVDFAIGYVVTDEDGDTASGTLNINVDDDTPTVDVTVASDANVLLTTQDAETDGDPTDTDTDSTTADFSGIFGASSAFGADGPGSDSLSYALSTTGGASGLASHGAAINLYLIGGVVVGSTAASAAAVNAGNTIFDISVDADGVVTVNQYAQIDHTNTDPSPTGPGYEDHLISLPDGSVTLTLSGSVTDSDGDTVTDSASVGIGANIRFADDGPTIDPTLNEVGGAVVDESEPVEAATIPLVGGFTAGDDPHLSGGLAIGKGVTSGPVIDANAVFGADGPANGGGISYALEVLNATSGLTTTEGTAINLVELANGVVVGVVDGTSTVAFAVSIDANTGVVTVEQYLSLFHPDSPDNFDEPVFLDEGSLGVTVTASDFDGDSVTSDAVDITSLIRFEDDGPSIEAALNANATVTVDESLPSGTPGIDTGGIVKGDDPDLEGGLAIGQANSGAAIVNANAVFGADGPAASGSLVYALSITNPDPGVTLTDGTSITMQLVNGVIVGVVDSGPFDGQAAFAIAIDPATGVVTVEQYLSLDHPVNPDPNDPLGLGDNSVAVNVTATDGDGDQVTSDDIDISGQITFLDDGPSADPALNEEADVTVDETLPSTAPVINTGGITKGNDPDLDGGIALGFGSSGEAVIDADAIFGADGPQGDGATYALTILGVASGVTLTDGTPINLVLEGGVVVGVVDGGAFDGQAAFAIAIDANTGVITVEQYLSLDHPDSSDPNDPLGLGDATVGATVTVTDGDGDPVTSDAVDISGLITFLDDGPSADAALQENATAVLDESLPSTDPVIDTPGITKGNDPDLAGGQAIGFDTTGTAVIDPNAFFGADGPAAGGGVTYSLSVIGASSGLTVTDGSPINLQLLANGVIVGVVAGGAFNGQAAFAIAIDPATGVVSVEQYLSLEHPDDTDHNDPLSMDELTVGVTATITDGDGDSITTDAIDISGQITFLDDGPNAAVNTGAPLDTLVLDETRPVGTEEDGDSAPAGLMTVQANFADNFVAPVNHGADGPGTVSYSFVLSGSNVNSGLYAIDPADVSAGDGDGIGRGTQIVLNQSGNTITGSANGVDYFTITIDANTGVVTFTQLDNIWHGNTASDDDTSALMASLGSLLVRQTVTDGDDDVDTADVDVSQGVFQIEDDGPIARNDVDDIAAGGDTATGNVITGVGTNGGAANADDVGEDLPGRVSGLSSVNEPGNTDQDPAANVFEVDGEFGTLVLNADGSYTYTRFDGSPGNSQDVFTYTLIDADGDTETATLTINIGDAAPNLPDPPLIRLDDDVIPGANGNPEGVGDDDPDAPDDNVVNGTLAGTGGDGTLTYNFTGVNTLPAGFTIGAGSDADTLLINQGGTLVMTIQLNQATGDFTVTQNAPIDHLAGNNENNFDFSIGVEVEDADGDVEPAAITINVDDDTPVLTNVQAGDDVTLDETTAGTPAGFPINATSDTAVITATQAFGADGAAAANSVVYGLAIVGGSPEPSGLVTAIGDFPITLVQIDGDTIQGQYNGANVAFTIQMNANGTVTLTQNVPLEHNVDGAPGAPHNDALDLTGLINATITITDGDGDSATASAPIGDNLVFLDDGPDAQVDGQATLDQLVLDETRPLGTETDGDSNPAGLATVQANFANNFVGPVDYGADGAGTTTYSLFLSGNGIGSGLYALDPTDTSTGDGDGFGQGAEITLSINGAGTLITGSAGGTDYFTISIDPNSGVVTFTQLANVWHADTANDDDTSSLSTAAASNVQVVQRVTDSDGDFDTAAVNIGQGVFHIEDDGPEFTAVDAVLNIDNDADPSGTGNMDFDLGSDGPSANNNVISVTNFNVSVNGIPLDPSAFELVEGAETATTASYTFSFEYDTGSGGTATANGTLVFDKVNGSYTVDLDGPIQGFSILQTATGTLFQGYEFGTSNLDGSQPEISVTQIQGTPGDPQPDDLFVQFTSVSEPSSGTGDNNLEVTNWAPGDDNPPPVNGGGDTNWNAGQLFNQADGWVSTSNTANGVDGDTIQGGEVLDFTLVQGANPTGVLADPSTYGQASSMFLKFDGIGTGEDMIVVLKLYDANTDTYTTRAVMIQNSDIIKGPGTGPGDYSGITLDNNDGLVIIESNDYNLPGENWVIVGAQIAGSDEGVTGSAINLNGAIGAAGDSDANNDGVLDTQAFSTDANDGPFKISSIGFVTTESTDQNATLDFDVTITEADGDSETTSVSVNIGDPPADALVAESSAQTQSFSKTAANDDFSSLLAGDGGQKWSSSGFGNVGTTGITSAMVAASGLAMASTSLQGFDNPSGQLVQNDFQSLSIQAAGREGFDDSSLASISLSGLGGSAVDAVNLSSSGFSFDDHSFGGRGLDAMAIGDAEPAYVPTYASGEPAAFSVPAFAANVPTVSMASAEMLSAAGLNGNAQLGGSVEQVLADALGDSAPTIDGILANLPGGIAGLAAISNPASPDGAGVPAWDMGMHGGFAPTHDMLMKVAAVAIHQDAVQPA